MSALIPTTPAVEHGRHVQTGLEPGGETTPNPATLDDLERRLAAFHERWRDR